MQSSQQTWLWRKSESMSVPHRKPPTRRLAPSPQPSPSQRQPWHPAPAMDPTVLHPLPCPLKPQISWHHQKSVLGRSQLRRPWPFRIQAAGIHSSNYQASSPGTPVRSQNESRAIPLVNAVRPVDQWRMPAQHIPQMPPQPAEVKETFHCPGDPSTPSSPPSADFPVLQQSQQLSDCLYRYK